MCHEDSYIVSSKNKKLVAELKQLTLAYNNSVTAVDRLTLTAGPQLVSRD